MQMLIRKCIIPLKRIIITVTKVQGVSIVSAMQQIMNSHRPRDRIETEDSDRNPERLDLHQLHLTIILWSRPIVQLSTSSLIRKPIAFSARHPPDQTKPCRGTPRF